MCYRLQQLLHTNLHKCIQLSCLHISIKSWSMAKRFTEEEDVLLKCPPKALTFEFCEAGICWKMKACRTHRISLVFSIFPSHRHWPTCIKSCATGPNNAPAILLTHWPWLTELCGSWRDANQPSPREISLLHLSPVPNRYITSRAFVAPRSQLYLFFKMWSFSEKWRLKKTLVL